MKNNWISVKYKLPSNEDIVIVFSCEGVDILQFISNKFYHYIDGFIETDITHWMPLPEPPK